MEGRADNQRLLVRHQSNIVAVRIHCRKRHASGGLINFMRKNGTSSIQVNFNIKLHLVVKACSASSTSGFHQMKNETLLWVIAKIQIILISPRAMGSGSPREIHVAYSELELELLTL